MKVKVCGLTDATDMEGLLSANLDYLGFICYSKSKRWIAESTIAQKKYGTAKRVGVFVNEEIDRVVEIAKKNNFDVIQLHGDESPEYCSRLNELGFQVIKVFGVDEEFDFDTTLYYKKVADFFLFDTKGEQRGGNGYPFNWDKLQEYKGNTPFFLSGGIEPKSIASINKLNHPKLHAVDINSRFEISPGEKDVAQIKNFVNEIKKIQ